MRRAMTNSRYAVRGRMRMVSVLALGALALAGLASSAAAAPILTPGRTVPMAASSIYTLAGDGSFWVVRSNPGEHGEVFHFGPLGEMPGQTLGEFPITMNRFNPKSVGFYAGEVLIASSGTFQNQLYTWPATSIGTSAPIEADEETEDHFGNDQFSFRINPAGVILAAFGDNNKVGLFNANTAFGEHPYYETSVMGAGINGHYVEGATPFESCESRSGVVVGEPKRCGDEIGEAPSLRWGPQGFAYPDDIAEAGGAGFFVTEYSGFESSALASITFVELGAGEGFPRIGFRFGPPGSGEGEVIRPLSIVHEASTGRLFVSEEGNRRIDVFDSAGGFLGAYGYGVHDGADTFEACGGEVGGCQAAVPYTEDPRSLFTRLDLGPEGDLYAFEPKANQVQVFSIGASGGGEVGGGGEAGGGVGTGSGTGLGAVTTPVATSPVIKPLPKPLICKKGFAKKKVKGVTKCVKKAHHKKPKPKHKKHHH